MTDDARTIRLLDEALAKAPDRAPDHLLATVLDGVRVTPQRPRPRFVPTHGWSRSRRWLIGTVAAGLAVLWLVAWLPGRSGLPGVGTASPSPSGSAPVLATPSAAPSSLPTPAATPAVHRLEDAVSVEDGPNMPEGGPPPTEQLLTSREFGLPVTFWLTGATYAAGPTYAATSNRTIALTKCPGCISGIRIVHPASVACGTGDAHPRSEELAAAILSNPGLGAVDLGRAEDNSGVPVNMAQGRIVGRLVRISGDIRPFDANASNPDRCTIEADGPAIELRGDLYAHLMLLDVGGELVIIHTTDAGFDAPTGAALLPDTGHGHPEDGHPLIPRGAVWDTRSRIAWAADLLSSLRDLTFWTRVTSPTPAPAGTTSP